MRKLLFYILTVIAIAQTNLPTTLGHSVTINWADANNPVNTKYNIYRLTGSCPGSAPTPPGVLNGFIQLNVMPIPNSNNSTTQSLPVPGMNYIDQAVQGGQTYCYIVVPFSNSGYGPPSVMVSATVPGMAAVSAISATAQ
jgi:hypothetical protein